jgi:hypothetical protein
MKVFEFTTLFNDHGDEGANLKARTLTSGAGGWSPRDECDRTML